MNSCKPTTTKSISASDDGVVAPLNSESDTKKLLNNFSTTSAIPRNQLRRTDSGSGSHTLRTFVSVSASVESDTLFVFSKLSDEHSSKQLLSPTRLSARSISCYDRETRKSLHYREKLRALTERLAIEGAVDRSKLFLSSMKVGRNEEQENAASIDTQDDDIESRFGKICGGLQKKFMACAMNLCVQDTIVDPEGLVVSVSHKSLNNYDNRNGGPQLLCTESDGLISEVSSLTDETFHRYQARYRYHY